MAAFIPCRGGWAKADGAIPRWPATRNDKQRAFVKATLSNGKHVSELAWQLTTGCRTILRAAATLKNPYSKLRGMHPESDS